MLKLISSAIRIDENIQITVHGFLRSNAWEAMVTGTYPGDIVHITDPDCAEVYIGEIEIPGSLISLRWPMPWSATVNLVDPKHDEVAIIVNKQAIEHIHVTPMPRQFEVYTFKGSEHFGSIIVPEGQPMKSIFNQVFGPASHEACVGWVDEHIVKFY